MSIRTLLYSKLETGVHVTGVMIYDWLLVTAYFFTSYKPYR